MLLFNGLDDEALEKLLERAEELLGQPLPLTEEARAALVAHGGRRRPRVAQPGRELCRAADEGGSSTPRRCRTPPAPRAVYDKDREGHYNLISALHKSIRGSDPHAALYYLARMLVAGEDPLYMPAAWCAPRVEDIGLADPQALAVQRRQGRLRLPRLARRRAGDRPGCLYLATAPKSNAAYTAQGRRRHREGERLADAAEDILNAPTKLMKDIGYGKGYAYDHDAPEASRAQDYWPDALGRQRFYAPIERGFEREVRKRLEWGGAAARAQRGGCDRIIEAATGFRKRSCPQTKQGVAG